MIQTMHIAIMNYHYEFETCTSTASTSTISKTATPTSPILSSRNPLDIPTDYIAPVVILFILLILVIGLLLMQVYSRRKLTQERKTFYYEVTQLKQKIENLENDINVLTVGTIV